MTFNKLFIERNNRFVKHFSRERSGAALVEFGLISGILLFSILFVIQLGLTYLTTLQLEGATSSLARVVRIGQVDGLKKLHREDKSAEAEDKLTEEDVRKYVCRQLVFNIDCFRNSKVFIENASKIDGVINSEAIVDPFGSGDQDQKLQAPQELQAPSASRYVIVTVFLRSPFSLLGNQYDLRAATVVRNEPFSSTSG